MNSGRVSGEHPPSSDVAELCSMTGVTPSNGSDEESGESSWTVSLVQRSSPVVIDLTASPSEASVDVSVPEIDLTWHPSMVLHVDFQTPTDAIRDYLTFLRQCLDEISETEEPIPVEIFGNVHLCLQHLLRYTDVIDNAIDFEKLGGYEILGPLLELPDQRILASTLQLVGDLLQNNTYCQDKFLDAGYLPLLFHVLATSTDETVSFKALYAVSCLCRREESIIQHVFAVDGLSVIMCALQKPYERIRTKAAFLLTYLCHHIPECREKLHEMGLVQILILLLQEEFNVNCEHILSCLLALIRNYEPALQECVKNKQQLLQSLQYLRRVLELHPECVEIQDYVNELMLIVSP